MSQASSSTSSPELHHRRTALPLREPPSPIHYGFLAEIIRRLSPDKKGIPTPSHFSTEAGVMPRSLPDDASPPFTGAQEDIYDAVLCETCGSGDREDELLLCDRCDRGRHTFCLRPIVAKVPIGPWFCPDCAQPDKAVESFPVEESKIIEFFKIQNDDQDGEQTRCRISKDVRRRRRKSSLVMRKKKRKILPFVPTKDIVKRLKQMASLATALTYSKTEFSNELTYRPNMAPRSSNQAKLEISGIQVLSKEDKETVEQCRSMQKRGQCPPLLVVFDSREGFTVQADANIKDMTLIAELAGDVDYWEKRENGDCDCLMTLLSTANPSQKLVICPDKCGNISRFMSGINNHTPNGKKKQNVKCVRYDIDGESHVLLVACRYIAYGERLYCDYNEGNNEGDQAYPTHHFV